MKHKARLFGSVICVAGVLSFLHAQQINISGVVSDAAGKGIAGAIVSLTAAQKNAVTDANGAYSILSGNTAARTELTAQTIRNTPLLKGTTLCFSILENASRVKLDLYTLLGSHVRTIFEKNMAPGDYQINPFANDLPTQLYFLKISINNNSIVLVSAKIENAAHSGMVMMDIETGMQHAFSKKVAVIDSFLVGAVGYTTLSQTTDTYSGTKNFTLQKTVPAGSVQVVQTAQPGDFLAAKANLTFGNDDGSALPTVTVDSSQKYQSILGFGGAFTEATAYNLNKIGAPRRKVILNAYFNPFIGSGYTVCRTNLQSCDFCVAKYSYDTVPGDFALNNFSIQHETQWMIPTIKEAMTVPGAEIKIFASPWSPCAWMKTNNNMLNGGSLLPACADAWALFFVKYIQAMGLAGVPIWGVTIQNEPEATQTWESCIYTAASERDFLKNNLGPILAKNNVDVKVMIFDHNKDHIVTWSSTIFGDTVAAKYAWGTAFHWYSGDQFENVATTHTNFPTKHLLATEQAWYLPNYSWSNGQMYGHDILGDLNNWAEGWVDWNLVLDQNGLPRHDPNTGCAASVTTDFVKDSVIYNPSYFYIAQFSKYLRPGAVRLGCTSSSSTLEATTFRNTNGVVVVVVYNNSANSVSCKIKQGTQVIKPTIPSHAIADFIY